MGIALTDDHRELSGVARAFLTSQKVRWAARASLDAAGDARPPFWQNLAELGWLGLHIDERHGGSGYGLSELVVVIEELGRAVAPGLFVPTVIASAVVAKEGTDDQRARLLPALIDGTLTAGVGLDSQVQVTDGVADGEAGIVLGAGLAELLLVAAGDDVLVLERGRKGVSVDVPENFDPTRRSGRVRLDNVRVTTDDILLGAYESHCRITTACSSKKPPGPVVITPALSRAVSSSSATSDRSRRSSRLSRIPVSDTDAVSDPTPPALSPATGTNRGRT